MGALQELWEFSCVGGTGERHYISPLYLNQVGGSSTQVLWPTYEVAALCSWTPHLHPFWL